MPAREFGLMACVVLLAVACNTRPNVRTYELRGQVLAVRVETNEILVKHEDIKGFMPAMTMPYAVKSRESLSKVVPGDLITATLNVEPNLAWLSNISKTGAAPLPPDAVTEIPAAAGVHLLKPGDEVPDTPLTDQDDQSISLRQWPGHALVVTFIYTRCPLPQFCPMMDRRFAEIQALVAADADLKGKVRLLSLSFDPAHDRAAVLRAHSAKAEADPAVWRFATSADTRTVDRLAATFGVNVIREQDGTITHNLRTAVIDPAGRVAAIHDSNAWSAADIVNDLRAALHPR